MLKERKTSKFITDNIGTSSKDSDKEDSDEENYINKKSVEQYINNGFVARKLHSPKYKNFLFFRFYKFPPEK